MASKKPSSAQALRLYESKFYFGTFPEDSMLALADYLGYIIAIFREDEGLTVVFTEAARDELSSLTDKELQGPFALIAFNAKTSLQEIGMTSGFTKKLSDARIPANVFAGFYHDHVFVPYGMKDKAMAALQK